MSAASLTDSNWFVIDKKDSIRCLHIPLFTVSLGRVVLRRKAVAEEVRERAGLGDQIAKAAVCVLRDRAAIRIVVTENVAEASYPGTSIEPSRFT